MPSVGWELFHRFTYSIFFETLIDNIKSWYYKVRQLLQNETDNSYQEVITKNGSCLLQNASGITKCDKSLLQSALGITKCNSYYKLRRNAVICM